MLQQRKNMFDLKNKTAWITGGKRIGQRVAQTLAGHGANIVVSYRTSSREAEEIIAKVKKLKVKTLSVQCDVSSEKSVKEAIKLISKKFKKVDVLVNMASVFNPVKFEKITSEDWQSNFKAHVLGSFWTSQKISKLMPKGGHIINIADRTSIGKIYKGYLPYVVTKAAIANMTKALAVELGGRGIFVNAIAPGPILRPPDLSIKEWKKVRESSLLKYPIDDKEAVRQFAILVLYLSSVTMASGHIYPLDQGQNL